MEAWQVDISDEEWDDGTSSDDETQQNLPPPTYQDFEAALAGSGSSVKSKSKAKQAGGSVSFNLKDIPKRPIGRPSLIEKPSARPGMQEAAQPPPPPPPPTLGTRPRPRDGFVEATQVSKPPPRVVRNIESIPKKEAPPPPPPLMAAPTKPQAPPPPAAAAPATTKEPEIAAPLKPVEAVAPAVQEIQEVVQQQQVQPVKAEEKEEEKPAPEPVVTATAPAPPSPPPPPQLLSGKPARTGGVFKQPPQTDTSMADERTARRARSVQVALDLQATKGQIVVKVWQVNAAGLLVSDAAKAITGFIPLTELSHVHASAILAEERRIRSSLAENNSDTVIDAGAVRRLAMSILQDQELLVQVIAIDKESGRVIFSEKVVTQGMSRRPAENVSPAALVAAADAVGSLVPCRVRSVRPFGVFVDFPLKLESGEEEIAIGLVHSSEVSWDNALPTSVSGKKGIKKAVPFASGGGAGDGAPQMPDFAVGQAVTARLTHVDPKKARIFLSIRRATPNPLLETLDSLLANTGAAAMSSGMASGGAIPGPRQTIDAAVDIRPLLGDLPVAVKFVEAVIEVEGVISANLGVRLESRASSPDVEVYMAKETGEEASSSDPEGGKTYKLVLRQGRDVQEVEIKCVLERGALREVAAATVSKIGAQPQE